MRGGRSEEEISFVMSACVIESMKRFTKTSHTPRMRLASVRMDNRVTLRSL